MTDTQVVPEPEESKSDDLETQQNKLADQLSELSAVTDFPTGYRVVADPFEPADVDFNSSGWLLRVIQVQAWLYPEDEMTIGNAENAPLDTGRRFLSAIGAEDVSRCIELRDGVVRLTSEGADCLSSRLDAALRLQQLFVDSLETSNKRQATVLWTDAWDEENDSSAPALEPISASSKTWCINDFSSKAARGQLNLNPSYQRGDVWPTSDAQKLIESIVRGIPLPSIILLKPHGNGPAKYEVVDGKQRLTSILRFIGQHPQAIERVKKMNEAYPSAQLKTHFENNYKKFRRVWKTVVGEALTDKREAEYYFPFRLAENSKALKGTLSALAGKYYCDIKSEVITVADGPCEVLDVFEHSNEYKIPLIEYSDATPKQIHEVFHLYNRQGKHLNAEEIRNALFHDVDLVRLVLVASGDNPSTSVLANYVPESDHHLLKNIAECLDGYRFGSARYKRTKLLSWMLALLFQPALKGDGEFSIRSTAKQIDALFGQIREGAIAGGVHPLASHDALIELVRDTERCFDAHSSADCWDGRFKDDDRGLKWQELQLVASLVGVFLIGVVEDPLSDFLDTYRTELQRFTKEHRRPTKTQNKTQWGFIGRVAIGMVDAVGIDQARLDAALTGKYGCSCLPTLRAAMALYESRSE